MPLPAKSPRNSLAQRLERSRRHRQWLGKDSGSVGGGSVTGASVSSTTSATVDPVDKNHSSQPKSSSQGLLNQKSFSEHGARTTVPAPEKRESLIARRRRALELGKKRAGAPSPQGWASPPPEAQPSMSHSAHGRLSPAPKIRSSTVGISADPVEDRQTDDAKPHQTSEIRGRQNPELKVATAEPRLEGRRLNSPSRQPDSPCESMIYQATAMESHEGNFPNDEDPVTIKPNLNQSAKKTNFGTRFVPQTKPVASSHSFAREEPIARNTRAAPSWLKRSDSTKPEKDEKPAGRYTRSNVDAPSSFEARSPSASVGSPRTEVKTESSAYGATIETPEVVSVASLRASFNSRGTNQPIMPMNSTDPRVRQKMSLSTTPSKAPVKVDNRPSWQKSAAKGQYATPVRHEMKRNFVPNSAPPAPMSTQPPPSSNKFSSAKKSSIASFWEDRQHANKTESIGSYNKFSARETPSAIATWQKRDAPVDEVQTDRKATVDQESKADVPVEDSHEVVVRPPELGEGTFEDAMRSKWKNQTENGYTQSNSTKSQLKVESLSSHGDHPSVNANESQIKSTASSKESVPVDEESTPQLGPVVLPQGSGAKWQPKAEPDLPDIGPVILPVTTKASSPSSSLLKKEDEKKDADPADLVADSPTTAPLENTAPAPVDSATEKPDMSYVEKHETSYIQPPISEVAKSVDGVSQVPVLTKNPSSSTHNTRDSTFDGLDDPSLLDDMGADSGLVGDFDAAMEYASRPMPSYEDDSYISGDDLSGQFKKSVAISTKATGSFGAEMYPGEEDMSELQLSIKQSDSTSVYIEDEGARQEALKVPTSTPSLLTVEANPPTSTSQQNGDGASPRRGSNMRLTPSPRDNDAYRRGYFGKGSPLGRTGHERGSLKNELPSESKGGQENSMSTPQSIARQYIAAYNSPGNEESSQGASSRGMSSTLQGSFPDELLDGGGSLLYETEHTLPSHIEPTQPAPETTSEWMQTSDSPEDQEDADGFVDTDQWIDRDPDFDAFADDDSVSQDGSPETNDKPMTAAPETRTDISTHKQAASTVSEQAKATSWMDQQKPVPKKSAKKRKDKEVFDPFAEDDELKIENPEDLFSPAHDPFMTEESFSPLDWGTPKAFRFEDESPRGYGGGFEI